MPITPNEALYGFAAPALVAAAIFWIAQRFLSAEARERWPAALAIAAGFTISYALLQLGPWSPTSHWHWTPYALFLTALIGPVAAANGITLVERVLLYFAAVWIAAWFIVPTYADLEPSRTVHLIVWPLWMLAIAVPLDGLSRRMNGPWLPAIVTISLAAGMVVILLSGNAKLMQILGMGFAAMVGVTLVSLLSKEKPALLGAALPVTLLSGGYLLDARVQSFSEIPLICYLLPTLAPALLWIGLWKPLAERPGFSGVLLRTLLPIIACIVAVAVAIWTERDSFNEY
ncbi:hypothetical protein M4951_00480 [Blastopirellula sp. J2-11]|uniref:hypothetical protein n=1 Tax=Blastopirellula sp. J2-11 TaxID=2943192 RepID=UPI0021C6E64D|nr:hypothetical protein [Blastopirellula sp. J2-11]UUO06803.1 hypothetical protein M4951_00480 [Blastopirellula sp. J2-11]